MASYVGDVAIAYESASGSVFFEQYASDITRRVIERPVCDVLEAQQGREHDIADVSVLCAADNNSVIDGIRERGEVNLADVVETLAKIFTGEYGSNPAHFPM
ncbi:hypothetical protein SAMN05216339_10337 [Nitrosomonas eutropha]|uniref:Uncharacterized protein n=1 Tax=Nitrosomonas eutropha TaxID=916 RepID=A0A1I7GLA2_9PROT|nr:hypothetical protein [Nitrosomonas eutropha]SFU49205.1 hypothetical protein SAMN05216339_10337 [Nitrosomonas eutropha]